MKKSLGFIAAVLLIVVSGHLYAGESKVGVVNRNTVLQKSALTTSLNDDLTKRYEARQKELEEVEKQLQDKIDKLNIDTLSINQDEQTKLIAKIAAEQANLKILTAKLEKDIAIEKEKIKQRLTAKMNDVIKHMTENDQYVVFEHTDDSLVLESEIDITQKVVDGVKE